MAARDGKSNSDPLPMSYLYYMWRKNMGVSYEDSINTPASIMLQDLEYLELDATYSTPKDTGK